MKPPVFLTGATGFLGMEVLARLLERTATATSSRSCAPATRHGGRAPRRRRWRSCGATRCRTATACAPSPATSRATASGIEPAERDGAGRGGRRGRCTARRRSRSTSRSTRRARSTSRARARCIGFARAVQDARAACERFLHVSTAYVVRQAPRHVRRGRARRRPGLPQHLRADQVRGRAHRARRRGDLPLQRSPARASSWASRHRLDRRPSTSCTGRCARSRAGSSAELPAPPAAHVDVVPVDYVADALVHLLDRPTRPGVFNLVAGRDAPLANERRRAGVRPLRASAARDRAHRIQEEVDDEHGAVLPPVLRHGRAVRGLPRPRDARHRRGSSLPGGRSTSTG